ncbi:hypothetical protein PXK56_18315 [Phaeobacter gallaeciensis]|uniref:hypothetical protein n=1 Tax=Phaeobacter gallaeciensis TaxID=60890 RepID=UPI002380C121|nr:hypothetical protein [Phaeobacter gallaeciensis]MDE4297142.1 hypothetical protein [Phaeobacter gallaeciensis]
MSKTRPDYDPQLETSLASAIKGKITAYGNAAQEYAFIGSKMPEDHEVIEENFKIARYNLERTILTHHDKAAKRFAKAVCAMFEDDRGWSVTDLDGAEEFFALIGFKPPKAATTVE